MARPTSVLVAVLLISALCTVQSEKPKTCDCAPDAPPLPVCGSVWITFDNECLLKCADGFPLKPIAENGPCPPEKDSGVKPTDEIEGCNCTKESKPVCGSIIKEYETRCLMDCDGAEYAGKPISDTGKCDRDTDSEP